MCSVAGFCLSPESHVNARTLATALLCAGAERGDDACGASWLDETASITTQTRAFTPKRFTNKGFRLPKAARTAILHTRYATQGSPSNPLNNHPIERLTDSGDVLALVHNGVIDNDNALFADHDLPRHAQVDSEILPALLAEYGSGSYASTLSEVQGSLAVAWLDESTPGVLHIAKGESSPIHFAYIATPPAKKSKAPRISGFVFASTLPMLCAGLAAIGLTLNSKYVRHFQARKGEYTSVLGGTWNGLMYPWTPAKRTSNRDWQSGSTYLYGADERKARYGTYTGGTTVGQNYTDYDLHMDYCDPQECIFYCGYECPRFIASHARRTDLSDLGLPSDEVMASIVTRWATSR